MATIDVILWVFVGLNAASAMFNWMLGNRWTMLVNVSAGVWCAYVATL